MNLLSIYPFYTCTKCHREVLLWYEFVMFLLLYLQVPQGSIRVVWICYQFTYILAGAKGMYYCGMKLLSISLYTCRCIREVLLLYVIVINIPLYLQVPQRSIRVVWNCYQFSYILAGATGKYYCGMKLLSIYLYTCRCIREVWEWYEIVINVPIYLQVHQGSITVVWNCYQYTFILAGTTGNYLEWYEIVINIPIYLQVPHGSITVVWICYQFTYILAGATWKYNCGIKLLSIYLYTCRCHREVILWYEIVINLPIYLQVHQGSITV